MGGRSGIPKLAPSHRHENRTSRASGLSLDASTRMDASVDATVRITPLSLLGSAALGTTALAAPFVSLLAWGAGWEGGTASTTGGLLVLLALVLWAFAVGYRRHGRPVATRARADGPVLVLQVPRAWGKLFRDELRLDPRSIESIEGADRGLNVRGPAQEWWDPGWYEVRIQSEAAGAIQEELSGAAEKQGGKSGSRRPSHR